MTTTAQPAYKIGEHVKLDGEFYLPVRFVESSTLHEEPLTGDVFIDEEKFIELRDKENTVRFIILSSVRIPAKRSPGPCKGIKPYYWKGGMNVESESGETTRS